MEKSVSEKNQSSRVGDNWPFVVYGLSIVGGLYAASSQVWSEFYSLIKNTDAIKPLYEKRLKEKNALLPTLEDNATKFDKLSRGINEIETNYTKQINSHLKDKMGIVSEGVDGLVRGTWQRFWTISPYKRSSIVFSTAVPVAIAAGGAYLLHQNHRLRNRLGDIREQLGDKVSDKAEAEAIRQ
jgi:hypothetical protein